MIRDRLAEMHSHLEAEVRRLTAVLERIRDYPHGLENCCAMSKLADAALQPQVTDPNAGLKAVHREPKGE